MGKNLVSYMPLVSALTESSTSSIARQSPSLAADVLFSEHNKEIAISSDNNRTLREIAYERYATDRYISDNSLAIERSRNWAIIQAAQINADAMVDRDAINAGASVLIEQIRSQPNRNQHKVSLKVGGLFGKRYSIKVSSR